MAKKEIKKIFLSSISQNAGKTTISLGLYKCLRERKIKTAFMKPVGQQFVNVGAMHIDKDSYLIGEVFHCVKKFKEMSPVTIGRGFTEQYIMKPHKYNMTIDIEKSYKVLKKGKDAIILEGTGHSGVGSVIDLSNADVAKILDAKVIIISEGGIGRSIDEIMLNKALFDQCGVDVIGVIVNKVIPGKFDKIQKIVGKGLANQGVKLLGVLPLQPLLIAPTVNQIKNKLKLKLLCGKMAVDRRVKNVIVAAMEPHNMVYGLKDGTLVLASGDRIDNILLAVSSHLVRDGRSFQIAGIILTGGLMPDAKIVDLLKKSQMPVLITEDDTYTIASKIENMICKIEKTDKDKIAEAYRLVKKYVDVESILKSA